MKNLIAQITKQIATIQGTQFASFDYLSKGTKEYARHTVILGSNYHTLVERSVTELEILMAENEGKWDALTVTAAGNVMASLKKTLDSHAKGEQNPDYTKKDQYIPIVNGLNVNTNDNTIQLFGLAHTKVVKREGEYKPDNRRPLTVAQDGIRKQLSISKFREFALDLGNVESARVNGQTLELDFRAV